MNDIENSFQEWLQSHPEYEPIIGETHTQVISKQIEAFRRFADERFEEKMTEIEELIDRSGIRPNKPKEIVR